MKLVRITGVVLLLSVLLLSSVACGPELYQLYYSINGQGYILECNGCDFEDGEWAELTANPESGWKFDHWGGDASGTEETISIKMNSDKEVIAYFVTIPTPTPTPTLEPTPTPTPTPIPTPTIDPLALNPDAESYFHQTWEGEVFYLPPEIPSKLTWVTQEGYYLPEGTYVQPGAVWYEVGPQGDIMLTSRQNVHDPTMAELLEFLKEDQTNTMVYDWRNFVCSNFAITLYENAEAGGIRCAYVSAGSFYQGHALNAFQTTDEGLVFVDCTGNEYGTAVDYFLLINMGIYIRSTPVFLSDCTDGAYYYEWTEYGPMTELRMWW
jgi:hypothetical protein